MASSVEGYVPGTDFEEDVKDPLLELSLDESKELWLIQWPLNQLQTADLNGSEISLKLHKDGDLGSFKSSSGKTYDMVSFAADKPDATVIIAAGSESRVVGKISRRVSLVHYPEPHDFEKPISRFPSGSKSGESQKSSMSKMPATPSKQHGSTLIYGTSHDTFTSTHTVEQGVESTKRSKHKKDRDSSTHTEQTPRSIGQSSEGSRPDSHITSNSSGLSEKSNGNKSKEKKRKKAEESA